MICGKRSPLCRGDGGVDDPAERRGALDPPHGVDNRRCRTRRNF